MSAPGFWELVGLAVLALLIFGPDKLPGIARSVGKTLGTFKREAQSTMDELKQAADLAELREARRELRQATADIEARANLADPRAVARSDAGDPGNGHATALLPPPYDPDAT